MLPEPLYVCSVLWPLSFFPPYLCLSFETPTGPSLATDLSTAALLVYHQSLCNGGLVLKWPVLTYPAQAGALTVSIFFSSSAMRPISASWGTSVCVAILESGNAVRRKGRCFKNLTVSQIRCPDQMLSARPVSKTRLKRTKEVQLLQAVSGLYLLCLSSTC